MCVSLWIGSFCNFVSCWAQGSTRPENDTPEAPIRPQGNNQYNTGPNDTPETYVPIFNLKLHLIGFAMAGPAHCKMGEASASAKEECNNDTHIQANGFTKKCYEN